jgi:hypothetical protein
MNKPFKICSNCGAEWATLNDFLNDPAIKLIGYQANFCDLPNGLFLFAHQTPGCGTSLGLYVSGFLKITARPLFATSTCRPKTCPERCLHQDDLNPCPELCECSWVREVMQIIRDWDKQAA